MFGTSGSRPCWPGRAAVEKAGLGGDEEDRGFGDQGDQNKDQPIASPAEDDFVKEHSVEGLAELRLDVVESVGEHIRPSTIEARE